MRGPYLHVFVAAVIMYALSIPKLKAQESLPGVIYRAPAEYPKDLRARNVEGIVLVGFTINGDGPPEKVRTLLSPDPEMSVAAENEIKNSTFHPGRFDGRWVSSKMMLPLRFMVQHEGGQADATNDICAFYNFVAGHWISLSMALAGVKPDKYVLPDDAYIWARIGVDQVGNPIVEDCGHGSTDIGSASLKEIIERAIQSPLITPVLLRLLRENKYWDLAVPSLALAIYERDHPR